MLVKGTRLGISTYLFTIGMVFILLSVGIIGQKELAVIVEASRGVPVSPALTFTGMFLLMVLPTVIVGVVGLFFAAFQASIGITALIATDNLLQAFFLTVVYVPYMAMLGVVANEHLSMITSRGERGKHLAAYGEATLYLLALTVTYSYIFT